MKFALREFLTVLICTILLPHLAFARPGTGWPPLLEAAYQDDLVQVQKLLDAGESINLKSSDGSTALMIAAARGHEKIIRALLARGAAVNAQNNSGWSALMLATKNRHPRLVKLLLKYGANPSLSNRKGDNTLTISNAVGLSNLFQDKSVARPAPSPKRPEPPKPASANVEKPQSTAAKPKGPAAKVSRLLKRAERQLQQNRLTLPAGDNALETYRRVLRLDPGNEDAQSGIKRIADQYHALARKSRAKNQLKRASSYIDRGLEADPQNTDLLALRPIVDKAISEERTAPPPEQVGKVSQKKEKSDKIAQLLATGKQQLLARKLTTPGKDNALETFQAVLQLEPENKQAEAGLDEIAAAYLRLAKERQKANALEKSLTYTERGLAVRPQHPTLQQLQASLRQTLTEREHQRAEAKQLLREVSHLLAKAEQQLLSKKLTFPARDNALETFQAVLALDPKNQQAESGLDAIANAYLQRAEEQHAVGSLEDSLANVERGLTIRAQHPQLKLLKAELTAALAERERQLVEAEQRRREVAHLLAKAEQQLSSKKFTTPARDNALETLQAVLELDPENHQAQSGLDEIATAYLRMAQEQQGADELEESLTYVESGLAVRPQHSALQRLQADLSATLTERKHQSAEAERHRLEVARLLALGAEQLEAEQLAEPPGNNALDSFQDALALEPDNREAQAGLDGIAAAYLRRAEEQHALGSLKDSLANVERGLTIRAQHPQLKQLKAELTAALAERARRHVEAEQRRRNVAQLLALGAEQLDAGQLTEPPGNNALDSFQDALALEPDNREALAGLDSIAAAYLRLAEEQQVAGTLEESLVNVERGLTIRTQNPQLKRIKADLTAALVERERQRAEAEQRRREVAQLLAKAEQQLGSKKLTTPARDNALETFQAVLALEPENRQAESGLDEIAATYLRMAQEQQKKANALEKSLTNVERGLAVRPHHPALQQLQADLRETLTEREHQRAEAEQRRREVARLLALGTEQLDAGLLSEPPGNNALDSFQDALELEPDNREALAGIDALAAAYLRRAEEQQKAGSLEESLTNVEQGLAIRAQHPLLKQLKAELTAALGERERQQAEAEQRRREVARLLALGAEQLEAGQLVAPPGNNALDSFQDALALDPDNREGLAGLEAIAAAYLRLAEEQQAAGTLEESLAKVERGLTIRPQHSQLKQFKAELIAAVVERERQRAEAEQRRRKVVRLLTKAEQQLSSKKLTTPARDNALETFQAVLALEPENKQAESGLDEIATTYLRFAQEQQKADELEESLTYVERGLAVRPQHPVLHRLQADLRETLTEREHQRAETERRRLVVARLLSLGSGQLRAGQLAEPPGNNALDFFRAVLALDPKNREAQAGLDAIAAAYLRRAKEQLKAGALEESLSKLEEGLTIRAQHPELKQLKAELTAALDERERQRAEAEQRRHEVVRLLTLGSKQLEAGQLAEPTGNNALESFQDTLALEPENRKARAGLDAIAAAYLRLAKEQESEGALEESLAKVERGLTIRPQHSQLKQLKAKLTAALAERERQRAEAKQLLREVSHLLAKAEQQLNSKKLTIPARDNALETFQAVLALEPKNKQAESGLDEIAATYLRMAQEQQKADELEESLTYVERGLVVRPQHPALQQLQTDLRKTLAEREHQRAEAERRRLVAARLLTLGTEQLKAGQLAEPPGNNALDFFRAVLALEPGNKPAESGLDAIADAYLRLAEEQEAAGALEQSMAKVEQGLTIRAQHPQLKQLKAELTAALAERERQLAEAEQRRREVARLLARGAEHLEAGQLAEPPGNNALDSFQDALALAPENHEAQAGLDAIAAGYLQQAEVQKAAGALEESMADVARGLTIRAHHPQLQHLKAELTAALAEREHRRAEAEQRRREVADLLVKAEKQLRSQNLTTPAKDNALETFQAVLALEPENKQAESGLDKIAAAYLRLAEEQQKEDALEGSLTDVERGLGVRPQHPALQQLQADLREALTEQEHQRAETERRRLEAARLLALGTSQLEAGQLVDPPGNNALDLFRTVLALDPENREAQAGLDTIATSYLQQAEEQKAAGALEESMASIERGLMIRSQHAQLMQLKAELNTALAERERQRAEAEQRRREIARLLALGAEQLEAGQLIEPTGSRALDSFQAVLMLEPDNRMARARVEEIGDHLLSDARAKYAEGALIASLGLAERALIALPTNQKLIRFRNQVQDQMEAVAKAFAETTRKQSEKAEQKRLKQEVARLLQEAEKQEAQYKRLKQRLIAEKNSLHQSIQRTLLKALGDAEPHVNAD